MSEQTLTIVELLDYYTQTEEAKQRILDESKPALDAIAEDQKEIRAAIEDLARDMYASQGAKTFKAGGHEVRLSEKVTYRLGSLSVLQDFMDSKNDPLGRYERTTLDIDAIRKVHGDDAPGLTASKTVDFGIWKVKAK